MKLIKIVPIIMMIVTVILAITSYILLPDQVIVQLGGGGIPSNYFSKIFAVILPTILGIIGAIGALLNKDNTKQQGKMLILSGVGILVFILTLVFNL